MAEIRVPIVLEAPAAGSEQAALASTRRVLAVNARLEREAAGKSARAAGEAEKKITSLVRRAAGEQTEARLRAANEFARESAAIFERRRRAQAEALTAEKRTADASAAVAMTSADQANAAARSRAAEEGNLRNVVVQSFADQEAAAGDFRDTLAKISYPSIAAGAAAEIGKAAEDVGGYFRTMAASGVAALASLYVSLDKFVFVAKTLNLVRSAARGLRLAIWVPIRETAKGVQTASESIAAGLRTIRASYRTFIDDLSLRIGVVVIAWLRVIVGPRL